MTAIRAVVKNRKARNWGLLILLLYFFIYTWSIGYIQFGRYDSIFSISILSSWKNLLFRRMSPFLYEPIGYVQLFRSVRYLISPVNIVLGLFLSLLVFLNVAAVIYIYTMPKQCRVGARFRGLAGILPSFLSGFACCLPSILIPLASILGSATAFFSRLLQWLLPASILILIYGAISSLRTIKKFENSTNQIE